MHVCVCVTMYVCLHAWLCMCLCAYDCICVYVIMHVCDCNTASVGVLCACVNVTLYVHVLCTSVTLCVNRTQYMQTRVCARMWPYVRIYATMHTSECLCEWGRHVNTPQQPPGPQPSLSNPMQQPYLKTCRGLQHLAGSVGSGERGGRGRRPGGGRRGRGRPGTGRRASLWCRETSLTDWTLGMVSQRPPYLEMVICTLR